MKHLHLLPAILVAAVVVPASYGVSSVGSAAGGASNANAREVVPFPMHRAGADLVLDARLASDLAQRSRAVLTGVPLPTGDVDLVLERVPSVLGSAEVRVDGVLTAPVLDPTFSCWRGHVAGQQGSDVFLAFSTRGSRGWVNTNGEPWHLLAGPGAAGDWTASSARFQSETDVLRTGLTPFHGCVEKAAGGAASELAPSSTAGSSSLVSQDVLQLKLAVETDYQLYQRFNNLPAETNYLNQLFAAASARFDADLEVMFDIVYLGLHASSNDGWTSGDTGAGAGAMLDEFRTAWQGSLPNGANLAHFLSGAPLGGGVAYLDVLCNPYWSFAVSGDLSGSMPFPPTQGPFSWDLFVFAHELGHNFGTPHTHDFCPPIDQCAPAGSFGGCQTAQACQSNGTIMSYCHTCAGGMSNIALVFHPLTAALMRQRADASCLITLCAAASNYCPLSPNSYDPFGATIEYYGSTRISNNDLTLVTLSVPPGASAIYYYGQNATSAPFGNGYRCIGIPAFRLPVVQSNLFAEVDYALDFNALPTGGQITAGSTWNFQLWYRNPAAGGAGFNLSDALRIQFCP